MKTTHSNKRRHAFFRPAVILSAVAASAIICMGAAQTQDSNSTEPARPAEQWQTVRMRVTAYCPCEKCCGQYADGVTACGHKIQRGDAFVAADRQYAFGTEMIIDGYNNSRPVKVLDRGGAIRGDRLDLFFHTHQAALNWGVQYIHVKIRLSSAGKS